jgi:hypothetical protein
MSKSAAGRFVSSACKESLLQENQRITYCGVNVHWQNGVAERIIRDLKEQTHIMLLHAQHHWPGGTTTNLWPYTMQTASHVFNDAPTLKGDHKDKTPREIFTGMKILAEVRHQHTFGCPIYVTASSLQQGKSLAVWLARSRVGVNLGISPTHARSVTLVLSLKTGLVSCHFMSNMMTCLKRPGKSSGAIPTAKESLAGTGRFKGRRSSAPHQVEGDSRTVAPGQQLTGTIGAPTGDAAEPMVDDAEPIADEDWPPDEGYETNLRDEPDDLPIDSPGTARTSPSAASMSNGGVPTASSRFGATTRSGRRVRIPQQMQESNDRSKKWVSWMANVLRAPEHLEEDQIYEIFGQQEYDIQDRASDPSHSRPQGTQTLCIGIRPRCNSWEKASYWRPPKVR